MATIEDPADPTVPTTPAIPATPAEINQPKNLKPLCEEPLLTPNPTTPSSTTPDFTNAPQANAPQIRHGNAGDNGPIINLLVQVYNSPQADDFQNRLDEPLYHPNDRLLVERASHLIGHVQVSKHIAWFHGLRFPLARLSDFVTLPEYESSGIDLPLLKEAEALAISEGAILSTVRTDHPDWFEKRGWSRCRGQGHTRANTRSILSHLNAQESKRQHHRSNIEVLTWRHYQLDSILNVYQQLSARMWGTAQRSLENWQWLVGRKAHDQILIAVEPKTTNSAKKSVPKSLRPSPSVPGRPRNADSLAELNILGYAVIRDSSIVEMLTLPGHSAAQVALLSQACQDAIDHDHHFVSLHTPAADPLHELLVTAGGSWIADKANSKGHDRGQGMLKLLSPDRWIERLYPVLHERAREAGIRRPLEIDFAIGEKLWRFTLTRRSSRFESIKSSTSAIPCDCHTLQDLLTSNLVFSEALAQGRLRTTDTEQLRILAALFPPKLFWQSPFPLLRL